MAESEYRSGRKALLATIARFASGNLVAMALTLVSGLLAARAVGPEVLGLFGSIALVAGYAPWLLVGTANGIGREIPFWIAKGERERAESLVSVANTWTLVVAFGCAAGMVVISVWQFVLGNLELATGWFTQAFVVWVLLYGVNYLHFTYRQPSDFVKLSKIRLFQAAANLSSVVLVFLFGFYGLCMRGLITGATQLCLYWRWRPIRVRPKWSKQNFMHLVRIGFPIMFVGQLFTWWSVLNHTLVLALLGVAGLGLHSLVVMSNSVGLLFPRAVGQVVYPQMAAEYGRTGDVRAMLKISVLPVLILVPVMGLLVVVGWLTIPLVISALLPNYIEAVPAIQWNLLSWIPVAFGSFNNVYTATGKLACYISAMLIGVAIYLISLFFLWKENQDLVVFSKAMLFGRSSFQILSLLGIIFILELGNNSAKKGKDLKG